MTINILEYLEATARRAGDSVAIADSLQTLTFRQLETGAKATGSCLLSAGLGGGHIPVLMERGGNVFPAMLGVAYAGGIYTILDPELGGERITAILAALNPKAVLCDDAGAALLGRLGWRGGVLLYRQVCTAPVEQSALDLVRALQIDTDPLYTVFTSGSTGEPKGVLGCHRGVIDYIEGLCKRLPLGEDSVFASQSPLYFDAYLKELIPVLKFGGRLELLPKGLFRTPMKLVAYLNDRKVNTLCWVASAFAMVSALGTLEAAKPEWVKLIAYASEVFPPKELEKWRTALPGARFFNLYGPTEATGVSTCREITGEETPNNVGRPFPNTRILLLDETGSPANQGEICILGSRLTLGYLGENQGGFSPNPLNPRERMYRTGDLGKWNSQGELEFLGRRDSQIKHLGHRIELGEIEAAALKLPGVREAACVYTRNRITLVFAGEAEAAAVKAALTDTLPGYMVPKAVTKAGALPRLANGKVDRKAL